MSIVAFGINHKSAPVEIRDKLSVPAKQLGPLLEQLMDAILERQERLVRVVCDRFADDLALVLIEDDIAQLGDHQVRPDSLTDRIEARMRRLVAPAREHDATAASVQARGDPGCRRCLARSAHDQVTDAHHAKRQRSPSEWSRLVENTM